jgi:hypothetical protein
MSFDSYAGIVGDGEDEDEREYSVVLARNLAEALKAIAANNS